MRKNSVLQSILGGAAGQPRRQLLLGGAAVYRCDNWLLFSVGFSRCGEIAALETLFPPPV